MVAGRSVETIAMTLDPFRRIILATDFSANARIAFDHAVALARHQRADLHVLHAVHTVARVGLPLEIQEAISGSLATLSQLARREGIQVSAARESGRPWEALCRIVRAGDVVVIGARGHGGLPGLLGSTADRIVRTCSAPVLTIHPTDTEASGGFRTVLVATDFSPGAAGAAAAAARLLDRNAKGARLAFVHAWQPLAEYYGWEMGVGGGTYPLRDETEDEARSHMESFAAPYRDDGFQVSEIIRTGHPVRVITEEAAAIGANLVALGTSGHSGLMRFMMGSVAERLVHHAKCPVLTVHEAVAAAAPNAQAPTVTAALRR
jgi:nucleotide-binding universal stress UspA family protein